MIHVSDVKSADDAINRAVHRTVVHVAETLVRQEGLLLPVVHNYFLEEMNACAIIDTSSENKQVLTVCVQSKEIILWYSYIAQTETFLSR